MAWGRDFIEAISSPSPVMLRYELEVTTINDVPGSVGYRITSHSEGSGIAQIGDRGVRVTGSALTPGTWSSTLGQIEIDIVGSGSDLLNAVTRGSFVVVYVLVAGLDARWHREVLAYGQVQQYTGRKGQAGTLVLRDLLSALRCRPTVDAPKLAMFYGASYNTTVNHKYHAGDATLITVSTNGFERETGGNGAVLVAPTVGDPFVLRWSSATATDFTLASPGSDQHGTVRTTAEVGDLVQSLFLVEDHPIDAARKILCSTGSGGNGDYDTLPKGWGVGLRDAWIDHDDCDLWLDASRPAMVWEVMSDAEITDPWSWLSGVLASGGFYVTTRQGKLTVRAALPSGRPSSVLTPVAGQTVLVLTLDDVEEYEYEAWDQDAAEEVYNVTAYGATTNASAGGEDPATLPAVYRAEYDLAALLFTAEADGLASVVDRVAESHQRIPERYALACCGLRCAQLAPGDQVELEFAGGVAGIVTQVSPDWGAHRVKLTVIVYPPNGEVWP